MKRARTDGRRPAAGSSAKALSRAQRAGRSGMLGAERRHLRKNPVVRLAQRGRVGDGLQVRHPGPGAVERIGRLVEGQERVLEGGCSRVALDRGQGRLGALERRLDRRLDEGGLRAPTNGYGTRNRERGCPASYLPTVGRAKRQLPARCRHPGHRLEGAVPQVVDQQGKLELAQCGQGASKAPRELTSASFPPSVRRLSGSWILAALSSRSSTFSVSWNVNAAVRRWRA